MKILKSFIAASLIFCLAFSFSGCHKKDENAVTVGKIKFTSAYYMCALINADSEAKNKVKESLSEEEAKKEIDYYSKKVEKKDFVKWVEDEAINYLKKIAAYKTLCKENKLEISEEQSKNAEMYASYYWSNYGYSSYFEPNGVGQKTYNTYMKDTYYSNLYFEHLYGEKGKKALKAEDVKAKIYDNFVIADTIQVSFSDKKEDEITALKNKLNGYVTDLNKKTKTFEDVYKDYNGSSEDQNNTDNSTEKKPLDKYATIIGAKDTAYASDNYDTIKALATGEVKLIELENNAGLLLAVKQDIKADPYYIENLDLSARHLIADDEYNKSIDEYAKKLDVKKNNYAIKQFKVKKIVEPKAQNNQ